MSLFSLSLSVSLRALSILPANGFYICVGIHFSLIALKLFWNGLNFYLRFLTALQDIASVVSKNLEMLFKENSH